MDCKIQNAVCVLQGQRTGPQWQPVLGCSCDGQELFFFKKTYFTFIFYKVAFCQLFIKVMMDDGWMAVQSAVF